MVWIQAILIVFPILMFILAIPSMISIYKIGYNEYLRNIRSLYKSYDRIWCCYRFEQIVSYKLTHIDGSISNHSKLSIHYYYPMVIDGGSVVSIVDVDDLFFSLRFTEFTNPDNNKWTRTDFTIRNIQCLLTILLKDRLVKKLESFENNYTKIDDLNELDRIINADVLKLVRDNKVNLILND